MDRLAASLRETPVVEREGYHYFVHPVSDGVPALDPALLREIVVGIVGRVDFDDVDAIVAPEAMGIHIATATSLVTDVPMVIVRKRGYGLDGEVAVSQVTGYSESELYLNDVSAGDRVVVLDDVLSTGGTLSAVTGALRDVGADVTDVVCVIGKVDEDGTLADVDVPVQTLIDVDVVDGEVVIVDKDGSP